MSAIVFLDNHPGWSWVDLQATPDRIVQGLKLLDYEKATRARK